MWTDSDRLWLAGVFDACGMIRTKGDFQPHIYLLFRTREKPVLEYVIKREWVDHGPYGYEKRDDVWWHLEITQREHLIEFLQSIRDFSPINLEIAKGALFMLEQEALYPDPRALALGRAIAKKLWEVNQHEYPI